MEKRHYSPDNFINRELSWLEFNERVLEEANDRVNNPLLERLKFASIVSSNLDEFFMVRVGSLTDQILAGFVEPDLSGLTPAQQVKKISDRVHRMVKDQYKCYNKFLLRRLGKEGIVFIKPDRLSEEQREYIDEYYYKTVYPVLTPMVVDQSRPFPLILNKSLNIALILENTDEEEQTIFGTVQVPSVLDRIIKLPVSDGSQAYIFLEDIIKMYIHALFTGHRIIDMSCYRITRNADQGLDEEGAEDLLQAIEQFLKERKWGRVIRLEVESNISSSLLKFLTDELEVSKDEIYPLNGPLDLTFLMKLSSLKGYTHLKYPVFIPQPSPAFDEEEEIYETLRQKDIMLHHPYESFDPVVRLVEKAAADPEVLAIKQTLYRVSGKSPIIEALIQAAEKGKQVTVLVELKARFDEENNIIWAKRLERAGCHVIYGLVGLKTHCKLLLIVRREEDGIKRYLHMGTGNYNDVTAKLYTDIGLFTTNPYFGTDASAVFNRLSGYSKLNRMFKMSVAPVALRDKFKSLISNEAENALKGKSARIMVKLNSLVDREIITYLYDASNAGVKIDLIVRGICCLKPGIPGVSENITVRSIVGRYLEHSRIYYFFNNGDELFYLSSADWMGRNLDRRVELLFPVEDRGIRKRIRDIIDVSLKDDIKARILSSDGTYTKAVSQRGINSQEYFAHHAEQKARMLSWDGFGENRRQNISDSG